MQSRSITAGGKLRRDGLNARPVQSIMPQPDTALPFERAAR
jgi:hypothetical protein